MIGNEGNLSCSRVCRTGRNLSFRLSVCVRLLTFYQNSSCSLSSYVCRCKNTLFLILVLFLNENKISIEIFYIGILCHG